MNATEPHITTTRSLERFLAVFGSFVCLAITVSIWRNVSAYQDTWPLPALYFIELPLLSMISTLAFIHGAPAAINMVWGTVGVVGIFSVLGAFSVGLLYVPVVVLFAAAAVVFDVRNKQQVGVHLAVCLLAALAQGALMLGAIRLLDPGAVSDFFRNG